MVPSSHGETWCLFFSLKVRFGCGCRSLLSVGGMWHAGPQCCGAVSRLCGQAMASIRRPYHAGISFGTVGFTCSQSPFTAQSSSTCSDHQWQTSFVRQNAPSHDWCKQVVLHVLYKSCPNSVADRNPNVCEGDVFTPIDLYGSE